MSDTKIKGSDEEAGMSTEVKNTLPPFPTQNIGQRQSPGNQSPGSQSPGNQSPKLFLNAPFVKGQSSGATVATPLEFARPIEGIPPGLEYLAELDHILFVNQSIDIADEVVGVFKANNWHIMNTKGQRIYIAAENKYERKSCCPSVESRPFHVNILDQNGEIVLKITRPVTYALCWWGGDSCGSVVSIFDGNENLLGFIKQQTNPCRATYEVFNSLNQKIFNISSNKCKCWYSRKKHEFEIFRFQPTLTANKTLVDTKILLGKIKKNWSGLSEYTSADTFGIQIPPEMEIISKGILIGAVFLIDFQFFEARNGKCTGCFFLLLFFAFLVVLILLILVITCYK